MNGSNLMPANLIQKIIRMKSGIIEPSCQSSLAIQIKLTVVQQSGLAWKRVSVRGLSQKKVLKPTKKTK